MQILLLDQHVPGTTLPIIRSSRVLYSSCCLWYLVLWFSSCLSGVELRVMCPVRSSTLNQQLEKHSTKYHRQQLLYNTLELLMMGKVVPGTCWSSNKICNKNLCYIKLAFYFHILTMIHGQNHIKFISDHLNHQSVRWLTPFHLYFLIVLWIGFLWFVVSDGLYITVDMMFELSKRW